MRKILLTLIVTHLSIWGWSQVGIGTITPDVSSVLDISSSDKGILIPQIALADVTDTMLDGVNTAATGLLIYNTNAAVTGGSGIGFYFFNGTSWEKMTTSAEPKWNLTGNTGTTPANFFGTIDNQPLNLRVNNQKAGVIDSTMTNTSFGYKGLTAVTSGAANTNMGYQSMESLTTSGGNTVMGYRALRQQVGPNGFNTALGMEAMENGADAHMNVAIGWRAMRADGVGEQNVALGVGAMEYGEGAIGATAVGRWALANENYGNYSTSIGFRSMFNQIFDNGSANWNSYNTGVGAFTLHSNNPTATSNGIYNTAVGGRALFANTTGFINTAVGMLALHANTTGSNNTAVGYNSQRMTVDGIFNTSIGTYSLDANTTGSRNIALGSVSLSANTVGNWNTALGVDAMQQNIDGNHNTALGFEALKQQTTASYNVGLGDYALAENLSGEQNVAVGYLALRGVSASSTPYGNTALGFRSMENITTGNQNTGIGHYALTSVTTGGLNIAVGGGTLEANTIGDRNVGMGFWAMRFNTESSGNVAIGNQALYSQSFVNAGASYNSYNVAVGYNALYSNQPTAITESRYNTAIGLAAGDGNTTGAFNTFVGALTDANAGTYTNATSLGYGAQATASNMVRIGNTGVTTIGGSVGWSVFSDARLKQNIREDVSGLDFVLKLRPVTYNLNDKLFTDEAYESIDISQAKQLKHTGFIAQEVEASAQSLGFDFSGVDRPKNANDHYGLRYAMFVVPLVKSVQEQQQLIEAQNAQIESLSTRLSQMDEQMRRQQEEFAALKSLVSELAERQ